MSISMQEDQKRMLRSLTIPGLLVLLMWVIRLFEYIANVNLDFLGLIPLSVKGLPGILFSPLLHAGFSHLFANTLPFVFLGGMLFYFYRDIAWKILWLIWIMTGLWVWFFARGESTHVGASGVVYGFAAFLFISGIIRKDARLMAVTLLITFLYGGLIWGIFPQMFPNQPISWESHLMGLLSGTILAFWFRNAGPRRKVYDWEDEDDEEEDDERPETNPDNEDEGVFYHDNQFYSTFT